MSTIKNSIIIAALVLGLSIAGGLLQSQQRYVAVTFTNDYFFFVLDTRTGKIKSTCSVVGVEELDQGGVRPFYSCRAASSLSR